MMRRITPWLALLCIAGASHAQIQISLSGRNVTGTLPLTKGGTGYSAASISALRTYLGIGTADSPQFATVVAGTTSGAGWANTVLGSRGLTMNALTGSNLPATWLVDGTGNWVANNGVQASSFSGPLTGNVTGNCSGTAASLSGVLAANLGGAGTVSGVLKANGSGTVSAAAGSDIGTTLGTQTANTVYSGPTSGSAAAPGFRALVAADMPYGSDINNDPSTHGFLAWTFSPLAVATSQATPASQTMVLSKVWVPKAITVANASIIMSGTAMTGTPGYCGIGLYKSDGTLVAKTATMASAFASGTNAIKTASLSAEAGQSLTLTGGAGVYYYLSILCVTDGTLPTFYTAIGSSSAITNVGQTWGGTPNFTAATQSSLSAFPAPFGTCAGTGRYFWMALS